MKKFIGLLLVVFVLGFCSNALAMDLAGKFGFTAKGGIGIPMGDFADEQKIGADMGFGFGGNGEFFITDQVALGGYFNYSSFGLEEYSGVDFSLKITSFGGFVKYVFPTNTNIAPYIKASGGLYKPKLSASAGGSSASASFDTKFGFGAGAGVMFQTSDFILVGGEVMFHNAMVKEAECESLEFGYDLQYVEVNFGVTFLVGGR